MPMFRISYYIDSWERPEEVKKRIKKNIELLKETIKSGDCKTALAGANLIFRMTVAEAIAYDVLEDIVEVVNLWKKFCEKEVTKD